MDALQKQLDDLKAQGKDDFKFLMIAFGTMGDRMEELAQDLRIVKGKIVHQEERFEIILDVDDGHYKDPASLPPRSW